MPGTTVNQLAKQKTPAAEPPLFDAYFAGLIRDLERDAIDAGMNFTQLCKQNGISRTTPQRWKGGQIPKTIRLVSKMQKAIRRAREARAKREAARAR